MKKITVLIIFLFFGNIAFAQGEVKAVMGINFLSVPSMQDYINQNFASDAQLGSFVSAVIFAGEGGMYLSPEFLMSVEAAYQIYSYTSNDINGKYDLSYNNFMPSLLVFYVISGQGYNFKFGGGAGIRLVFVDESISIKGTESYNSIGYGLIGRIEANTLLGGSVYANIGAEIRYDINGEPDNNGAFLYNNIDQQNVNFNTFLTGIRLGITYIIGENN